MYLSETKQNYLFDFNNILAVQLCNLLTLKRKMKDG